MQVETHLNTKAAVDLQNQSPMQNGSESEGESSCIC